MEVRPRPAEDCFLNTGISCGAFQGIICDAVIPQREIVADRAGKERSRLRDISDVAGAPVSWNGQAGYTVEGDVARPRA
ncbi:unannotated protein [freshwater metagenome]|uniref:Unannotated protein n=1 Tax=freshwater metagenome TaxID=449393 RepID=A0A6J6ZW88_9ZZZZ